MSHHSNRSTKSSKSTKSNKSTRSVKSLLSQRSTHSKKPGEITQGLLADAAEITYLDDDNGYVEIPDAGLNPEGKRLVPDMCAICLCNYEVGDDIVWSSNPACGEYEIYFQQIITKQFYS